MSDTSWVGSSPEPSDLCSPSAGGGGHCLSNKDLMQDNNLNFVGDSPFNPPPKKGEDLVDVNCGSVWRKGYDLYVKKKERDVLCPLTFFIDKTHMDTNINLHMEPITYGFLGTVPRTVCRCCRFCR